MIEKSYEKRRTCWDKLLEKLYESRIGKYFFDAPLTRLTTTKIETLKKVRRLSRYCIIGGHALGLGNLLGLLPRIDPYMVPLGWLTVISTMVYAFTWSEITTRRTGEIKMGASFREFLYGILLGNTKIKSFEQSC